MRFNRFMATFTASARDVCDLTNVHYRMQLDNGKISTAFPATGLSGQSATRSRSLASSECSRAHKSVKVDVLRFGSV